MRARYRETDNDRQRQRETDRKKRQKVLGGWLLFIQIHFMIFNILILVIEFLILGGPWIFNAGFSRH